MQHRYISSEEIGASKVEKAAHENDKAKAEKLTSNLRVVLSAKHLVSN